MTVHNQLDEVIIQYHIFTDSQGQILFDLRAFKGALANVIITSTISLMSFNNWEECHQQFVGRELLCPLMISADS